MNHARAIESAFALLHDEPVHSIALADGVLAADDATDIERAKAQWVRGMAHRERGDLVHGADDLFGARQLAAAAGSTELAAQIDTSLALVAMFTGSARSALELLDEAEPHLHGAALARLETQRGLVLHRSGDLAAAKRQYRSAIRRLKPADDVVGYVRALNNLAILLAQQGDHAGAEQAFVKAIDSATIAGQRFLAGAYRHNLGYSRMHAGRTAEALDDMRVAQLALQPLGRPELVATAQTDRAELLLHCNLLEEACETIDRAVAGLRELGNETELADALLLAARCRLAAGRHDVARVAALEAASSFRRQQRPTWLVLAEFVLAQLDGAVAPGVPAAEALVQAATHLAAHGWTVESAAARVQGGRLLLDAGRLDLAEPVLAGVRVRTDRPASERVAAHLAQAMLAGARNDRGAARRAVSHGLRVVAENQAALAALDARALAAAQGAALVELGLRLAISDRHPREVLERVESTRRTMWLGPDVRPPDDRAMSELLTRLRLNSEALRSAIAAGQGAIAQREEQVEIERQIRDLTRTAHRTTPAATPDVRAAVAALGERMLLEYIVVDDHLFVVTSVGGRSSLHALGALDGLADDIDGCTFALHRLNRAQGSDASIDHARRLIDELGRTIEERVLPMAVRRSGRPLVVVPDGPLHGLAWGVLPALSGRPLTVAPSLLGWAAAIRSHRDSPAIAGSTLVVGAPSLPGARREVAAVASLYERPIVLAEGAATVAATFRGLEHSRLAHVACHGVFRTDNPLFSRLELADGAVTLHDLQQCSRLPDVVVLSACDVAASSVLRGGTLLGLASALMMFGVSSVIAPLTPVNDEHVVDVMVRLHEGLRAGASPAEALAQAQAAGDNHLDPTAAAFVAIGG